MVKEAKKDNHDTSLKHQYIAVLVVNLAMMANGINLGWTSPSIILLTSDESPLPTGQITIGEVSWIASLVFAGSLMGGIFWGFIANIYGRKKPLILSSVPTVISWVLVLVAQNVYYLYAARLLGGFGNGGTIYIIFLFVVEVSNDHVRGVFLSAGNLTSLVGLWIGFVLGNFCHFYTTPIVAIVILILFMVLMIFFPETPLYLMKNNNVPEAEKSIRFYKHLQEKSHDFRMLQSELEKLENLLSGSPVDKDKAHKKKSLSWSDLKTPHARKAFTIGIVLVILSQWSGCSAMFTYAGQIFTDAGSTLTPNMSSIVVSSIQILGSSISINFVDRLGRKKLYIISASGIAMSLITFGVYMMLKSQNFVPETFNWIPLASFSMAIFSAAWATQPLPFVVISEIMPEQVKELGITFCIMLFHSITVICVKSLPFMILFLGFHQTMFLFAGICIFGVIFIIFFMPETKGKSYDQIRELFQ